MAPVQHTKRNSGSEVLLRSRRKNCARVIADLARVILSLAFSFRALADRDRVQLSQALHRAVARQVVQRPPDLVLSRRALRQEQEARPRAVDRQVDVLSAAFAVQRCGARVRSPPLAEECRIFDVQSLCRDPVDCSQHHQSTPEPDSRPACELAACHLPAVALIGAKMMAPLRPVYPAALHVQVAQANVPRALPSLQLLVVQLALVSHAQMVKAKYLPDVPEVSPSLQVFPVPRALVFLARMVKATHLRELVSRPGVFAQLYLFGSAKSAASLRPQPDSRQCRVMRCPLAARRHELAAARSWDFQF